MVVYICDRCGDTMLEGDTWNLRISNYDYHETVQDYEYCEVCCEQIKKVLEKENE